MRESGYEKIELADPSERLGRRCQENWYRLVVSRGLELGQSVLDVGAGDGYGMDILRGRFDHVEGIDVEPLRDDIEKSSLYDFSDVKAHRREFDLVVAMDVIEHVARPDEFIRQMMVLANKAVFFSTPNWDYSKCANKYHCFEFSRGELDDLLRWYNHEVVVDGPNFGAWIWSGK